MKRLNLLDLGTKPFSQVYDLQKRLVSEKYPMGKNTDDYLIICQHPPVYTRGRRLNGLLNRPSTINGIECFDLQRGGFTTYHAPGQILLYPILNLRNYKLDLHWYVHSLETVMVETCKDFGVEAKAGKDVGVWVNECKIGSIGIELRRWITLHGLALNVDCDLKNFDFIDVCGLGCKVTSLKEVQKRNICTREVSHSLLKNFERIFGVLS